MKTSVFKTEKGEAIILSRRRKNGEYIASAIANRNIDKRKLITRPHQGKKRSDAKKEVKKVIKARLE